MEEKTPQEQPMICPWPVIVAASIWLALLFVGLMNSIEMFGSLSITPGPSAPIMTPPSGTPPPPPPPWLFRYPQMALLVLTPIALVLTLRGHFWAYVASCILAVTSSINLGPFKVRDGAYVNELDYSIDFTFIVLLVLLLVGYKPYRRYCDDKRRRRSGTAQKPVDTA